MTWAALIRQLKEHGFQEFRTGKRIHRQYWNPQSGKIVTIAVHTKKEVGTGLADRILKDTGVKTSKRSS